MDVVCSTTLWNVVPLGQNNAANTAARSLGQAFCPRDETWQPDTIEVPPEGSW